VRAPANCRLIGRWRIVQSDIWDRVHLDLFGPATLTITAQDGESPLAPWRPVSKSNTPATRSVSAGPDSGEEAKSKTREPPNSSKTARSRSNSPTTMAMKPSSRRNG
jgi:hypothetical protein